uniref:Uncharacterized protein n=1 Tax=Rhizophora mucronata TaxID=61149 RepID=A0A2P2PIE0_RHIMU
MGVEMAVAEADGCRKEPITAEMLESENSGFRWRRPLR